MLLRDLMAGKRPVGRPPGPEADSLQHHVEAFVKEKGQVCFQDLLSEFGDLYSAYSIRNAIQKMVKKGKAGRVWTYLAIP